MAQSAQAKDGRPRAWQRMLSGRRLDLLDPSPLDIEIGDIAHGLARVARWNGQTTGEHAYSVAEHCVLVDDICVTIRPGWPAKWRRAALLHDAPEYVIGDMISPFKAALGIDYKAFEHRLAAAIHMRFGLPPELPQTVEEIIKRADRASAFFEATQIAGFSDEEGAQIFGRPRGLLPVKLKPLSTGQAQARFLKRFEELSAD
ncbi:MAG: HD family hydrolase [Parvibaculum sp.]|uniref:HD domain-containing protein n=1 Tax=Parvibaculum sp. TaxID=2024848 RepID=UPI0025F59660|nr:HD family hydrolase [Parvibaculum sp.]MCE9649938.1 HD family hydrolase [Parvibaculum sp.]